MTGRNKFLVFLRGLFPLKLQLKIEYRIKCKRKLLFNNPKRLTEKMQLYKYKYRNELMVLCADKARVPNYVKEKRLGDILVPNIGVYNKVEDIDFDSLPNSFIIKSNTGSGNNLIVKNKSELNIKETKKILKKWLIWNKWQHGTEWVYKKIKPQIIIEELLPFDSNNDLPDYKFFCFNGKVEFGYIMIDYTIDQSKGKMNFYNRSFEKIPVRRTDFPNFEEVSKEKPIGWERMIEYAEVLSKDFPHVRVDFYNINGKIYFGELTFFTHGGYFTFEPDEYDFIFGDFFDINIFK